MDLYPFDPYKVDYSKCVQNLLENKTEEEDNNTEADIKSTEKVLLKLRQKLNESGIDIDVILTLVSSLRSRENEYHMVSKEELNTMEFILMMSYLLRVIQLKGHRHLKL